MKPIGVSIGAIRDRDTSVIIGAAPPGAGQRRRYVMVVREGSRTTPLVAEIVVLGGVGVTRKADGWAITENLEQLGTIRRVDGGVVRIKIAA